MTEKRIVVRIERDGGIVADTEGFSGAACLAHVEQLERLLQAEAVESEFTVPLMTRVDELTRAEVQQRVGDQP